MDVSVNKTLNIVILAAGQGKRMNSKLPKVLHPISTKPMLQHVIETAKQLQPSKLVVVYGHGGDIVQSEINKIFANGNVLWAHQDQQLGTGHALKCALPYLDKDGLTLVLYGDVPLINADTLKDMVSKYQDSLVMLTDEVDNPFGYGRIIRDSQGCISSIVEEKDTNAQQKSIKEINTGFYIFPNKYLSVWLNSLSNSNSQGEYYLTDVVEKAYQDGVTIDYVKSPYNYEVMGVNNKLQLEELERIYQLNKANKLLESGVTIFDKKRIDIRGELKAGQDCMIDVNCIFDGTVELGDNVNIGAGCILNNVKIGSDVTIKAYSIIENSVIANGAQIGPYARLRPGTELLEGSHVGNFVEIKNSKIGVGSKVNHLTYIGDSEIGSKVNVGAGTVTCNYDGKNKFKTVIGDNVFVGSGSMLVAPVNIGSGALIAAGSVITKDAVENELTVARAKQITIAGWLARNKK